MTDSSDKSHTPIEDSQQEIQGSFTAAKVVRSDVNYASPQGDAIIQGARDILKQSPTGLRLIQMADYQGIAVTIIRARAEAVTAPDGRTVVITLKPNDKTPTAKHALMLAYGIRQAEQNLLGFTVPSKEKDLQEYTDWAFGKNLDALKNLFRIYDDLQSVNGIMNLFDSLKALEVDSVYEHWKLGVDDLELSRMLIKNRHELEKQIEG